MSRSDGGLQAERTALAWRRTALAIIVGGLAAARAVSPAEGWAGPLLATVTVLGGGLIAVVSAVRARTGLARADLSGVRGGDGLYLGCVSTIVTMIALAGVVVVLDIGVGGAP